MEIGFIGIGRMGRHMARHVLEGGHDLRVFDLVPDAAEPLLELGARWADSAHAAAEGADIVFTALPGPHDVLEVALGGNGLLAALPRDSVYVDLSTVSPQTIRRISDAAGPRGVHVIDCPVSGGVDGAEAGTLCLMAGGDRAVFDRIRPVLDLIGDPEKVIYCGPVGSGSVCKIVNNLIGLSTAVVLSEAFALGMRAGLDVETLYRAVSRSTGHSVAVQGWPDTVFAGNFEPGFSLALAAKDLRLATDLGRQFQIPMEFANLVDQKYTDAMRRGLGDQASAAVARLQEERAGVEIRYRHRAE